MALSASSRRVRIYLRKRRCAAGIRIRTRATTFPEEPPEGAPASWSQRSQERAALFVAVSQLRMGEKRALDGERFSDAQTQANRLADIEQWLEKKHRWSKIDVESGILLRSQLQAAVEEERYLDAAQLRDRLNSLSQEMSSSIIHPQFRLGHIVQHTSEGWRGIVCGFDSQCEEDDDWLRRTGFSDEPRNETHYIILVDEHDVSCASGGPPATYAPESELMSVDDPPEDGVKNDWAERLTLGRDAKGHYLPTRYVRDFHKQERQDIWP